MGKSKKLAESVLDYWFTIEFLSQDAYPSCFEIQNRVKKHKKDYQMGKAKYKSIETFIHLTPKDLNKSIYDIVSTEAMCCGMKKWGNLTFYIGKVKREKCIESIAKNIPGGMPENRPEKRDDSIAMLSLQLSPEGKYIEKSLSLSSVIWALGVLKNRKENLSEAISSSSFHNTMLCLEEEYFNENITQRLLEEERQKTLCTYAADNLGEELQDFAVECVTWKELKTLYEQVLRTYVAPNIEIAQEGDTEEVYGLGFQMFVDDKTKECKEEDNYLGLSHDYFSNDIQMVLRAIENNTLKDDGFMGKDLLRYIEILSEEDKGSNRIDLVNPQDQSLFFSQLNDILSINNAPLGKWPSRFMPALMQQVAINFAINKGNEKIFERNGKVFSVNGPPGTGKTTLLKEIVVSNIVERAILLAEYDNPDDAFAQHKFKNGSKEEHAYSTYTRRWYKLKNDKINDYSMLVTSCNNAAVENISKELPQTMIKDLKPLNDDPEELVQMLENNAQLFDVDRAIEVEEARDGEKYKDIYFSKYAAELLGREDVWGLIAVPLGKKSNIKNFYFKVLNDLLYNGYVSNESIKERKEKYHKSRDNFKIQLAVVKELQNQINQMSLLQQKMVKAELVYQGTNERNNQAINEKGKLVVMLKMEIAQNQELLSGMEEDIEKFNGNIAQIKQKKQEVRGELVFLCEQIRKLKEEKIEFCGRVNIFTKIFKPQKYKAIMAAVEEKEDEISKKKEGESALQKQVDDLNKEISICEDKLLEINKKWEKLVADNKEGTRGILDCEQKIACLKKDIEDKYSNYEVQKQNYINAEKKIYDKTILDSFDVLNEQYIKEILSEESHVSTIAQVKNPWLSQRYNREREKLFSYAMTMNKNFILSSKACRDNLITLSHYWGVRPGDDKHKIQFSHEDIIDMIPSLYQTLFLLVPVISSTFASVGTLLRDVKQPGTIGMLVVDEAGQAQPQMAVGGLYRSRRAVIVGDPKQVEPVVTDDLDLLKEAFTEEKLSRYKEKNLSVQVFADRLNLFGTYLENGTDYPEWIGSPLLVHRRCISPMYDISNQLSYNGIMKQQTNPPKKEIEEKFALEKSCWINVEGKEQGNKNHFVQEQGEKVCELLEQAFFKNQKPSIYIISPFTTVVSGIKKYIQTYCEKTPNTNIDMEYMLDYQQKKIGTVHTFQGKEANEVIFLLGCDDSESAKGAITWVNENIVNVAVTRAKYRLYVIGDREAWKKSFCVSVARKHLEG